MQNIYVIKNPREVYKQLSGVLVCSNLKRIYSEPIGDGWAQLIILILFILFLLLEQLCVHQI